MRDNVKLVTRWCVPVLIAMLLMIPLHDPSVSFATGLGATTSSTAKIWVRWTGREAVLARIMNAAGELTAEVPVVCARPHSTGVVTFRELGPSSSYTVTVFVPGTTFSRTLALRTAPPDGESGRIKILFGSCFLTHPFFPHTVLDFIYEHVRPDAAIFLGDNIYGDLAPLVPREQSYRSLLSDAAMNRFVNRVPVYWQYDDHEFGNNFDSAGGAAREPLFQTLIRMLSGTTDEPPKTSPDFFDHAVGVYNAFLGSRNPESLDGSNNVYTWTLGDLDFFMLETRSQRSPCYSPHGEHKTMLGAVQKRHLKKWLASSTATFKFVCSSVAFSGAIVEDHADGWKFYPDEKEEVIRFAEENNVKGMVLLSGDIHWTAIWKLRSWLFEAGASPISAFPLLPSPNLTHPTEEVVFSKGLSQNFGIISTDTATPNPYLNITLYSYYVNGMKSAPVHTTTLFASQLVP